MRAVRNWRDVERLDAAARAGAEAYLRTAGTIPETWDTFTSDQRDLAQRVALAVIKSWKSTAR